MDDKLLDFYKNKKLKNEKIFIFSFFNNYIIEQYNNFDIDILRFDIEEFSFLNGYKNDNQITEKMVLPVLKNPDNKKK